MTMLRCGALALFLVDDLMHTHVNILTVWRPLILTPWMELETTVRHFVIRIFRFFVFGR